MASAQLPGHIFHPNGAVCLSPLQLKTTKAINYLPFSPSKTNSKHYGLASTKTSSSLNSKWVVRLSLVEQSLPKPTVNVERLVDFLYEDLPHLFDDQGIDPTAYDEHVKFRDPITKHDSISGYLFNISLLKMLFNPLFQLHWVKQVPSSFSFFSFFFFCLNLI